MYFWKAIFGLNIYLTCTLSFTAVIGDYLTLNFSDSPIVKAALDNGTHFIIGGFSWFIFYLNSDKIDCSLRQIVAEIFLCALMSSLIDLDHFIAAKSFFLKDAIRLQKRPFLHCSTIPIVGLLSLLPMSYVFQVNALKRLTLIFITAFVSHHVRDATRRGFWFYPFGTTAPIPYLFYIFLTCLIPFIVLLIHKNVKISTESKYHRIEIL
ncbi:transmembrane protein 267 [Sitophilus oryzae]|uniref:Transmembrane protein 267 n=1 Tax=Sitophilus oryzae TaxID=7048 RepID=A0A6J2YL82_SITOR|nr:transmembrane protein 267 [Sitophilus oryzae]